MTTCKTGKVCMSEKTYVPSKPCKNCGTSLRYKSNYGCAECIKRAFRKKYENNPELRKRGAEWARKNPKRNAENTARWAKNNPEKVASTIKKCVKEKWEEKYKERSRINSTIKRKLVKLRTPRWADLNKIREFYKNCPPGMTVDHIIPFLGERVSGLHVHTNLQYLSKHDNCVKSNKFSVEEEA